MTVKEGLVMASQSLIAPVLVPVVAAEIMLCAYAPYLVPAYDFWAAFARAMLKPVVAEVPV